MNIEPFKRESILVLTVVICIISFTMLAVVAITLPAIRWQITSPELRSGLESSLLPPGWTWTQILLLDIGLLLAAGYLSLPPLMQILTKFTNESIEQPALFHNRIIHWRDVQKIYSTTRMNIEIRDSKTKIHLNPSLFTDPSALLSELHLRVPFSAFSTRQQVSQKVKQYKRNHSGQIAIGTSLAGLFIFISGKTIVAFALSILFLGYGVFEFEKWLKLGRLQEEAA